MLQFRRWHSDVGAEGFLLASRRFLFTVTWNLTVGSYKLQFEKFDNQENKQLYVVADDLPSGGSLVGLFRWSPVPGLYEGGLHLKPNDVMQVRTHPDEPLAF